MIQAPIGSAIDLDRASPVTQGPSLMLDLRACYEGYAGIPQEVRLLFAMFSGLKLKRFAGLASGIHYTSRRMKAETPYERVMAQTRLLEVRHGGATTVRDFRRAAGLDLLPRLLVRRGALDLPHHLGLEQLAVAQQQRVQLGRGQRPPGEEGAPQRLPVDVRHVLDDVGAEVGEHVGGPAPELQHAAVEEFNARDDALTTVTGEPRNFAPSTCATSVEIVSQ